MNLQISAKTAAGFLADFYSSRGIRDADMNEKYRTLEQLVIIPNFPYKERKPALYELELQLLRDNEVISPDPRFQVTLN